MLTKSVSDNILCWLTDKPSAKGTHAMPEQSEGTTSKNGSGRSLRIQLIDTILVALGTLVTIAGIIALIHLMDVRTTTANVRDQHDECISAATDLMEASDYLTTQARLCVSTSDLSYMDSYLDELLHTRRRDHAVATLRRDAKDGTAATELEEALNNSNSLAERELYAMRLTAEAEGVSNIPKLVSKVELSSQDQALSPEQKHARAQEMLLGYEYNDLKSLIVKDVDECTSALVDNLRDEQAASYAAEKRMQTVLLAVLLTDMVLLGIAGVANAVLVLRPIHNHEKSIQDNEPLSEQGAEEIRNVARAYNRLYSENLRRTMLLRHQAETDPLTGLLNRGSFDRVLLHHGEDIALVIADIDFFKRINDTYGHEVGDETLRKVGTSLAHHFRTTDYVCRIGGDEFAVILTEMSHEMRTVVSAKLDAIFLDLADTSKGVPAVTLSAGIAFSATLPQGENIYHAADKSLYKAKHGGRSQYVFNESE